MYLWADGRAYVGDWKDGKQEDERVYILPNGECRKGKWVDGVKTEQKILSEEEAAPFKAELESALKAAKDVE